MKVGITFFSLDLLIAENAMMLKKAKQQADYLIVGLHLDKLIDRPLKEGASQSVTKSYLQLKASSYVDEIIPYSTEQDIEDILRSFKIDIYLVEKNHIGIDFIGKKYCLKKGIEISYNSTVRSLKTLI